VKCEDAVAAALHFKSLMEEEEEEDYTLIFFSLS
jgi:hypothetical protein